MSNLFVVTGRVCSEPKKQITDKGHMKVTFSISDKEWSEDSFYGVSYFLGNREVLFEKGDKVLVDGRLRTGVDSDGKNSLVISASRVLALESKIAKIARKNEIVRAVAEGEMKSEECHN